VYLYPFFILGASSEKNLTPIASRFIAGKERGYTFYRGRCGPLGRSKRVWKSTPLESDPRTVFEASRCSNSIYILFSSQNGIIGLIQNICIVLQHTFQIICSVDPSSLYNLVNETNFVHDFFLVYFVNFIYNLYMFWISPSPSSGWITVFIRHFVFVILFTWESPIQDGTPDCQPNIITSTKCRINTVVLSLIFMDPCIVVLISRNNQQDAAL